MPTYSHLLCLATGTGQAGGAGNAGGTASIIPLGTLDPGQTLIANAGGITDPEGVNTGTITYQWKSNGVDIPQATAATYVIASGYAGSTITVEVSFQDNSGNPESITSSGVSISGTPVAANSFTPVYRGVTDNVQYGAGADGAINPDPFLVNGTQVTLLGESYNEPLFDGNYNHFLVIGMPDPGASLLQNHFTSITIEYGPSAEFSTTINSADMLFFHSSGVTTWSSQSGSALYETTTTTNSSYFFDGVNYSVTFNV